MGGEGGNRRDSKVKRFQLVAFRDKRELAKVNKGPSVRTETLQKSNTGGPGDKGGYVDKWEKGHNGREAGGQNGRQIAVQ